MEYQALYRKWRPMTFDDVVGQEHICQTLKNEIKHNRIAHAYLFCGTRGTGKTSTARIFSRTINCTNPQDGNPCNVCETCVGILDGSIMDVFEMDAASNNGIDNIREIRDEIAYAPSRCKYKIYIIDEAHMITKDAFNALLKTLEEPPPHVVFILATTEPHRISAPILSRCQRFDFRQITINDIALRLLKIAEAENIDITPDAAEVIAGIADGSMRDAVSALDRCASQAAEQIKASDVSNILGIADKSSLFGIAEAVAAGDVRGALLDVGMLIDNGAEVLSLFEDLITHYRNLLIANAAGGNAASIASLLDKTEDTAEKYITQAEKYTSSLIIEIITTFSEYVLNAKWMSQPRVALEMALVKVAPNDENMQKAPLGKGGVGETGGGLSISQSSVSKADSSFAKGAFEPQKTEPIPEPEPALLPKPITPTLTGDLWKDVLSAIKEESKQLFGLLSPAKANVSDGVAELVITNSVAFEKVSRPEGIKYLEELFSKLASEKITVKITNTNDVPESSDDKVAKPQSSGIDEIIGMQEMFGNIMEIE